MMSARIVRLVSASDGTLGAMVINGMIVACTLEPYWRHNRVNHSCIPTGQYRCVIHQSPRYGQTWMVTDVAGRTNILIHPGNVVDNTSGCILVGSHWGKLGGNRAVLNSGATFQKLFHIIGADDFHLTIVEAF